MSKLLIVCGIVLLLTGMQIIWHFREAARAKTKRIREILLLVLWGIVFAVFSMPFVMILITPHK